MGMSSAIRAVAIVSLIPFLAVRSLLFADEPKKAKPAVDFLGDPLPVGAVARLGSSRLWHGKMLGLTFCPDGKELATLGQRPGAAGSFLSTICWWDATTGRLLREIRFPRYRVTAWTALPDGKRLALGIQDEKSSRIALWDIARATEIDGPVMEQNPEINFLTVLADGRTMVSRDDSDNRFRFWDLTTRKQTKTIRPLVPHKKGFISWHSALSRDGKRSAWHIRTYKEDGGNEDGGEFIQVVEDGKIIVFESRFRSNTDVFIALSSDGKRLLWGCGDKLPNLVDLETKKTHSPFASQEELEDRSQEWESSRNLVFSSDGKFLAYEFSQLNGTSQVKLWNVEKRRSIILPTTFSADCLDRFIAFSQDGQSMAINDFEKVRLYDVQTGKERVRSPDHHRSITELIFSSDGRNLFSGDEAVVCNWTRNATDHFGFCPSPQIHKRMEAFNRIAESNLPQGEIFSVDLTLGLNRDHELLTLSQAHPPKNQRLELEKDGGYTNDYISPDNQRVLLRRHKPESEPPMACEIFDTTSGKRIGVWPLEGMLSSTFGPDSRFFAWQDAKQGQIILGNLRSGKIVKTFSADLSRKPERPAQHFNFGGIPSKESRWSFDYLALCPDNQRIAAVWNSTLARLAPDYLISDQDKEPTTLYVWDIASGKETTRVGFQTVNKKMPQLTCLAFLRDGRTLAAGYLDNADVHLIESASGRERAVLHGHQGTVRSLVLSPDGRTLLSGSDDTTILVWDLDHLPSPDARKDKTMLSAKELKQLWEDLAYMDAGVAFQAIETLRRCPEQAVTLLQERLQPITAVKPERIEQWIRDLDNNEFPVRERASTALECLAEIAEPALKRALEKPPSLEVRLRLQRLMETTNRPSLPPDRLRQVRGVELLERIATPTAREHLRKLANGAVEARLTHEAKEGLRRTSSGDKAK